MIRRFLHPCRRDCGASEPTPDYRDVSFAHAESPDQAEILDVVGPTLGAGARVLHVGVGSSALARRFAARVAWVEGITVVPGEVDVAPALPNYRVSLLNKYAPALGGLEGPFHLVVDNNPGSFACCRRHFTAMMDAYAALLAPSGRLVTHRRGARWSQVGGITLRWPHWRAEGRARGLQAEKLTRAVWSLRRA